MVFIYLKEVGIMKITEDIDTSKYFCWNPGCSEHNKKNQGNIKPAYYDGKDKEILYLKCTICNKTFSENKGTFFFRKKIKKDTIVKALKSTSEGQGIRPTSRIFDVDKNTILSWVKDAGNHSNEIEKIFSEFTTKRSSG